MLGKKNKTGKVIAAYGADQESLDFSDYLWSWKGSVPNYSIQADGFSYDVVDENGNDKNAICLGILGMVIIVFNAQSSKIREQDIMPVFKQVIAHRSWHTMTEKEANMLSKTAILKLTSYDSSGDVFELASYAPIEIKRFLLKKLFVIASYRIKPEFEEEGKRRIIDDIVPRIFETPELELALLTGLIIRETEEAKPLELEPFEPYTTAEPVAEDAPIIHEESISKPKAKIKKSKKISHPAQEESEEDFSELSEPVKELYAEKQAKYEKVIRKAPEKKINSFEKKKSSYVPFSDMEQDLSSKDEVEFGNVSQSVDAIDLISPFMQTEQTTPAKPVMPSIPKPPAPNIAPNAFPVPPQANARPNSAAYPQMPPQMPSQNYPVEGMPTAQQISPVSGQAPFLPPYAQPQQPQMQNPYPGSVPAMGQQPKGQQPMGQQPKGQQPMNPAFSQPYQQGNIPAYGQAGRHGFPPTGQQGQQGFPPEFSQTPNQPSVSMGQQPNTMPYGQAPYGMPPTAQQPPYGQIPSQNMQQWGNPNQAMPYGYNPAQPWQPGQPGQPGQPPFDPNQPRQAYPPQQGGNGNPYGGSGRQS